VLSGKAQVCCVHDREKRVVVTEEQLAQVGLSVGIVYDPRQHRIHSCGCCGNLFADPSDEPRYCHECRRPLLHMPAGPLAAPIGPVG
jgi:hypothetical protein